MQPAERQREKTHYLYFYKRDRLFLGKTPDEFGSFTGQVGIYKMNIIQIL